MFLAQYNEVVALDSIPQKVKLQTKISPIKEVIEYVAISIKIIYTK